MADLAGTPGKRPRSDSAGSVPESKRPSIQKREEGESSPKIIEEGDVLPEDEESTQDAAANNGDTVMTDAQEGSNEPTAAPATSSITPAPASAGLPETPVAAAAAAEAAAAASSTEPTEEVKPVPLITMRALIVTQDASIIIGKGGTHIREIRDKSGSKVAVSEAIPNNPERILNVSGPLDAVSKAFGLVVRRINDEPFDSPSVPGSRAVTIRFIVPNARMGSVIGKSGSKIKEIQEASGARLQASEAMLPGSTERVLTISGVADAIHIAVYYVGTILQEQDGRHSAPNTSYRVGNVDRRDPYRRDDRRDAPGGSRSTAAGQSSTGGYVSTANMPGSQTQQIYIPNDLVGSIIGKAGQKINEIRQMSQTHIKIMEPHEIDPATFTGLPGERLVTISGQPTNIQMAVQMLYHRLEQEKQKQISIS